MDRWSIVATLNYLPHEAECRDRAGQGAGLRQREGPQEGVNDGARGRPDPERLHQRRPLNGDEPAHGDHLGRERRDFRRHGLRLPADLPQQVRRARAADRSPSSTSAASARTAGVDANVRASERRKDSWKRQRKPDRPIDPFKRVTAAAMKTVAGRRRVEVTFGGEQPGLVGNDRACRSRRAAHRREVAITRGLGGLVGAAARFTTRAAPSAHTAGQRRAPSSTASSRSASRRSARRFMLAWGPTRRHARRPLSPAGFAGLRDRKERRGGSACRCWCASG